MTVACRARCEGLAVVEPGDIDAALASARRVVVVGADADLASVLTRLLRAELLDVEVAYVPRRRTPATRAYRLPAGRRAARRARRGSAQRVPLIRDETGSAIVGAAEWGPAGDAPLLHGEAVVDDAVLFDGDVARRADRADDGAARVAGPRDRWPVTPLADRPGRAAGRRRDLRGSRWCGCAADHAPLDDLPDTPRVGWLSGDERR